MNTKTALFTAWCFVHLLRHGVAMKVYAADFVFVLLGRLLLVHCSHIPLNLMTEFNNDIEKEFQQTDLNNNGILDLQEFETQLQQQDLNNDGCISFIEFNRVRRSNPLMFTWAMFNHFDHNQDDCLEITDEIEEFSEIDINPKDNELTLKELESYYDQLYETFAPMLGIIEQP
ncbi:uncharacterized protein LOC123555588 [Mercenaria mercenaria]|uniref:uncharacterized protein LOC123555588 n=1 Tax=Mercenaria mercenaria TaxID=6596 RepID=UPI00234F7AD0|nr:uncharacterized protein LOC123555588 [Mercenaria mercenaria]